MMNLAEYFDIYVISLPEREDRRRAIRAQFRRHRVDESRVVMFEGIRPLSADGFPSVGAHGCFLSHLEIMKGHRSPKPLLICEDDLDLDRQFEHRIDAVLETLESEPWDIFYAGAHLCGQPSGHLVLRDSHAHLGQTHMIAYRAGVLPKLIRALSAMLDRPTGHPRGPMHVDHAISFFRGDNPDVLTRVAVPALGVQRASISDIQTRNWHDRAPLVRTLVPAVRALKNWLRRIGILRQKPSA